MTPLHARHKDFRFLYKANHKIKNVTYKVIGDKEKQEINKGYLNFWRRRKRKPPYVSDDQIGVFDI